MQVCAFMFFFKFRHKYLQIFKLKARQDRQNYLTWKEVSRLYTHRPRAVFLVEPINTPLLYMYLVTLNVVVVVAPPASTWPSSLPIHGRTTLNSQRNLICLYVEVRCCVCVCVFFWGGGPWPQCRHWITLISNWPSTGASAALLGTATLSTVRPGFAPLQMFLPSLLLAGVPCTIKQACLCCMPILSSWLSFEWVPCICRLPWVFNAPIAR